MADKKQDLIDQRLQDAQGGLRLAATPVALQKVVLQSAANESDWWLQVFSVSH
jgi:hypothetical protein